MNKIYIKYLKYAKSIGHDYIKSEWPEILTNVWAKQVNTNFKLRLGQEETIKIINGFKKYTYIYICRKCNVSLLFDNSVDNQNIEDFIFIRAFFDNKILMGGIENTLNAHSDEIIIDNELFKLNCDELIIKKLLE